MPDRNDPDEPLSEIPEIVVTAKRPKRQNVFHSLWNGLSRLLQHLRLSRLELFG